MVELQMKTLKFYVKFHCIYLVQEIYLIPDGLCSLS